MHAKFAPDAAHAAHLLFFPIASTTYVGLTSKKMRPTVHVHAAHRPPAMMDHTHKETTTMHTTNEQAALAAEIERLLCLLDDANDMIDPADERVDPSLSAELVHLDRLYRRAFARLVRDVTAVAVD
jgi:hypothetical protein